MSVLQPGNVAYGLSQALIAVANQPIIAQRAPTTNDRAAIGTLWIDEPANIPYILTSIVDNVATWISANSSGSVSSVVTDSGTAIPVAGVLNIFGGANIVTSASGNTVDVAVTDNINLPATNAAGTQGLYELGGLRFAYAYPPSNAFLGITAGNTTLNPLLAVHNTGIGNNALIGVTTGNSNTAIGAESLSTVNTGLNNTALGYLSGNSLTTGDSNVALGNQALEHLVIGNDNIAVGFAAGVNYTGAESSNLLIGNAGLLGESNVIRIGTQGAGAGQQDACAIAGIYNTAFGATNQVVFIDNSGFVGSSKGNNGEIIIGATAGSPAWATITAGSDIMITNGPNSITIDSTVAQAIESLLGDNGGTASGIQVAVTGGNNITTAGDNADTLTISVSGTTNHALQLGNASGSLTSLGVATNGQIPIGSTGLDPVLATLTAGTDISIVNAAGSITINSTSGSGIVTIDGDSGSATGATVTFNGLSNAGSTTQFTASGSTVDLVIGDNGSTNMFLGFGSGNGALSGTNNTLAGVSCMPSATTAMNNTGFGANALLLNVSSDGNTGCGGFTLGTLASGGGQNTALGYASLASLINGVYNIGVGYTAGTNYTGAESFNIAIGHTGILGDNATIRLGDTANNTSCFIAGIGGVTPGGSPEFVIIDPVTGELGSTASGGGGITTIDGDSGSATGATITFNANTNCGSSVDFTASGATVDLKVSDINLNTLIGLDAGNGSVSGSSNVGLGVSALHALTSGTQNTACGLNSLVHITTPSGNSGFGFSSLFTLTTGQQNTALGITSLNSITTGSSNIGIGDGAGGNYTSSESSNIVIGNAGTLGESNVIRIGTQGSGSAQQDECFIAGIAGVTVASSAAVLINTSTGQLGTVVSSRRYKDNIEDMDDTSNNIMNLRPVIFNFKNDPTRQRQFGLIAEEVDAAFPDIVTYNKVGDPETVRYHDLPVLLLNELQKQNNVIAMLQSRIQALENRGRYESAR